MADQLSREAQAAIAKARAMVLKAAPHMLDVLEELRGRRGRAAAVRREAAFSILEHVPPAELQALIRRQGRRRRSAR